MKALLRTILFCLFAGAAGISVPVNAHHSFAAEFDAAKPVTLTGTVTKVAWTNPHIFIYMNVEDEETSEVENWTLELGGPNSLMRLGWRRDSLKEGDLITVEGSLARDGRKFANAQTIVLVASGRRMLAGSSRGADPENP